MTITKVELDKSKRTLADALAGEFQRLGGLIDAPPPPPQKTTHFVLVHWGDAAVDSWGLTLGDVPPALNQWLARFGLKLSNYVVESYWLPGQPSDYRTVDRNGVVHHLRNKMLLDLWSRGLPRFDGNNAIYLFMLDRMALGWGGTIGGDVYGQHGGQEGERLPGISWACEHVLYALRYDKQHPSGEGMISRNWSMGAIMHELGHNLCLYPCVKGHSEKCVMRKWWIWPDNILEVRGSIWTPNEPHYAPGNELEAAVGYGFLSWT